MFEPDDDARRIHELEAALARERRRSTELERRASAMEEAARRAFRYALAPVRPREE